MDSLTIMLLVALILSVYINFELFSIAREFKQENAILLEGVERVDDDGVGIVIDRFNWFGSPTKWDTHFLIC